MPDRIYRFILGAVATSLLLTGCAATGQQSYGDPSYIDEVEYLYEYGEWMDHPDYGEVWLPYVVSGWHPYYHGHWIWTGDGWAWTSYEPFGWLVYHYGYWGFEPGAGWFWVPEGIWGPARVEWYNFGDYMAWAPMAPPGVIWPDPWDYYPVDVWVVVYVDHFADEDIGRRAVKRSIYGERTLARDVNRQAPDIRVVERVTKRALPVIEVKKRDTTIRTRSGRDRTSTERRTEPVLEKMDLPKTERRKVDRHEPRVEREVLKTREKDTEKETDPKRKRR